MPKGGLSFSEAFVAELSSCSIGSGNEFHLLQLLERMEVTEGHHRLIEAIQARISVMSYDHHVEMAQDIVRNLRKEVSDK